MNYAICIIFIIGLALLIFLRVELASVRKAAAFSNKAYFEFAHAADEFFLQYGSHVAELTYRSRLMINMAEDSAEKIAAIHIILGAAHAALSQIIEPTGKSEDKLEVAADKAIAFICKLEILKQNKCRRWGNLFGKPMNMTRESIDDAKRRVLIKFAQMYATSQ